MGREGLSIAHLFFANDSIIFRGASREGILAAKAVVNEYEKISDQLVNFDK